MKFERVNDLGLFFIAMVKLELLHALFLTLLGFLVSLVELDLALIEFGMKLEYCST